MKRTSLAVIIILALTGALAWLIPVAFKDKSRNISISSPSPTSTTKPSITLADCYYGLVGKDQLLLKVDLIKSGTIRAKVNYQFFEKDSSWGFLEGNVTSAAITGIFSYFAEGMLSTRDVTYTKSGENYIGDGFILKPNSECTLRNFGVDRIFRPVEISKIKTTSFHDPETGFYVKSEFTIVGAKAKQNYRCYINAVDKDGVTLQFWAIEGISFDPRPGTRYSAQTNLTPDQVPLLSNSFVECSIANLTT